MATGVIGHALSYFGQYFSDFRETISNDDLNASHYSCRLNVKHPSG